MITAARLRKASPDALARLFCWLTFRPMHLSAWERVILRKVREAMGTGL